MPTKLKDQCAISRNSDLFREMQNKPFREGRIMQALMNETCRRRGTSKEEMICPGDIVIGGMNDMPATPHADLVVEFGEKGAPNTVVKYFSLSCKECARFIREAFPLIQRKYIAFHSPAVCTCISRKIYKNRFS